MVSFTRRRLPIVVGLAAAPLLAPSFGFASMSASAHAAHQHSENESLRDAMRRLWDDHVFWTRLYIVSALGELPDKDVSAQRLLQNQTDIGAAIVPYYGQEAGDQLSRLLQDHILGAATLLDAVKSGDQVAVETANAAWYANADDIATFLSTANPDNWPLDVMQETMKMHLDQTLQEVTNRMNGNHEQEIADFDAARSHMLVVADVLTQGIEAQFPNM